MWNIGYFRGVKKLIFIFSLFLIIGCNEEHQSINSSLTELKEELPAFDERNEIKWYEDSVIKINEKLIGFKLLIAHGKEYTEKSKKYLRPNEKSESKIHRSDLRIEYKQDSIIVSFWQFHIFNCKTFGNIEIKENTINLLFSEICSPYSTPISELALVNFKYIIRNSRELDNLSFQVMDKRYSEKRLLK